MSNKLNIDYNDTLFKQKIADNDESVYRDIMITCFDKIKRTLHNLGCTDDLIAEEIAYDSITALFLRLKKGQIEWTARIDTFLISIARNKWSGVKRMKKSVEINEGQSIQVDETNEIIEKIIETENNINQALDCLNDLGEMCQKLIKSFYLKQKSLKQISIDLGHSNYNVTKTARKKCVDQLKRKFYAKK